MTTPAAPAASAVRMIAPRFCGSSTPSSNTSRPGARAGARFARQQIFQRNRRARRHQQRHYALMLARARGAIELHASSKRTGTPLLSRQLHDLFQAVAVAAARDEHGLQRPPGSQRFAHSVNSGEFFHGAVAECEPRKQAR